jgi:hypothetical protein
MDIRCLRCDGNAVQLLKRRPDGSTAYVCVGCGATAVFPDPNKHEESTAATLLRDLRLMNGKKHRTGRRA